MACGLIALPNIAHSAKMKRDLEGNLVVDQAEDLLVFPCGEQNAHVLKGKNTDDLVFIVTVKSEGETKSLDFSGKLSVILEDENYSTSFELKCFSDKTFIWVHIAHKDDASKDLHLKLMNDGRIIDGYNLTANGFE